MEEINGNKYLIFDSTDGNKELIKKYDDFFNRIRNEIKTINGGKGIDYEKYYMKIKQIHQNNVIFVTIAILKILVLRMNHIFAMVVTI